jgi:hypothetical protein
MTDELSNTNQLKADEMTVDTDASHTTPRHLTVILYALRGTPRVPGRMIQQAATVVLPVGLMVLWWVLFEVDLRPRDASEWFVLMPLPALIVVGVADSARRVVSLAYALPLTVGLAVAATAAIQAGPTTWSASPPPWNVESGPLTIDLGVVALATSVIVAFYAVPAKHRDSADGSPSVSRGVE